MIKERESEEGLNMATAKTEPRPVRIPSLSALWRRKPKVLDQWVAPIEAHQQEAEAEEE